MIVERVLERPPLVLDQSARRRYFEDGFLMVPGHVGPGWLGRLRAVVAAKIDESRALTASDDQFGLPGSLDREAEHPAAAQDGGPASRALGVRPRSARRGSRRRSSRPGRPLPQLEAQLQVVGGRGCRALAPEHPGLGPLRIGTPLATNSARQTSTAGGGTRKASWIAADPGMDFPSSQTIHDPRSRNVSSAAPT